MTEVKIAAGRLRGARTGNVHSFKGIPFAAPPFGANRFRPPTPPARWDRIRDATAFGVGCPQPVLDPNPERTRYFNPVAVGEDCLNLNVWSPDPATSGLPVVVWIHGGGYISGAGSAVAHDGTTWARDGVVHVSINYRLHAEGFIHLDDERCGANLGLRDQVAALVWVRDNIASFGGDPDRVTIFGQSGGGVSVMHLLAMPAGRGLFRRAIIQSGSTRVIATPELEARIAHRFAEIAGVAPTVDALRVLPIRATVNAATTFAFEYITPVFWGSEAFLISPFRPVLDPATLPVSVPDAIGAGHAAGVDVMAGCTTDEATFAMEPFGLLDAIPDVWASAALDAFGLTAADLNAYGEVPRPQQFAAAWTDWAFRQPTDELLDAQSSHNPTTYRYEFCWPSPTMPRIGAAHALELPFVNDALDAYIATMPPADNQLGDAPPQDLAAAMHKAWIDFATHGDPGWPAYDPAGQATMRFGL